MSDPAPAWSRRYARAEMTTAEADAWRAGRDAALAVLRASNSLPLPEIIAFIERLQPTAPETGLCGRGA